jgi:hypothetical protein
MIAVDYLMKRRFPAGDEPCTCDPHRPLIDESMVVCIGNFQNPPAQLPSSGTGRNVSPYRLMRKTLQLMLELSRRYRLRGSGPLIMAAWDVFSRSGSK